MRWLLAVVPLLVAIGCDRSPRVDDAQVIDVFGPYRDTEADDFAASIRRFEDETGLTVRYTGSTDFVRDLRQRIENGVASPDIAVVAQPGVIDDLVAADHLVALGEESATMLRENYPPELIDESAGGEVFSAPTRQSIKSLVWYRPSVFDEHGWSVPSTLDELVELVDRIQAADRDETTIAPWCFTMEAGTATGWVATDWVEDLVLRIAGPEAYDEWASRERGFSDPGIREALTTFDELVLARGRTAGGLRNILQTSVADASAPLFGDEPGCAMYKQASFAESWFPDDVVVGRDVDFFVLPGTDAEASAPIVVGGDSLVQFSDDPVVHRLMAFLISPEGTEVWAERGGYYSGLTTVDLDTYYTETDRRFAALFRDDRELRFDASDSMPPDIGTALFWSEATSWISGTTTLDQFVEAMDSADPAGPQ